MYYGNYSSPVGVIHIYADVQTVIRLSFSRLHPTDQQLSPNSICQQTIVELKEYFAGTRHTFTLPLAFYGTPFQQKVWTALSTIPYGTTVPYQQISHRIHHPNAQRAIGQAVSRNPFMIVVPCHRVIRSTGAIGGYAGGQHVKKYLLDLEKNTEK